MFLVRVGLVPYILGARRPGCESKLVGGDYLKPEECGLLLYEHYSQVDSDAEF